MIDKTALEQVINEALEGTKMYLVTLKVSKDNIIDVALDSDEDITIDDCVAVNDAVLEAFDRDVEDYELSVLSWGLSGVLKMDRQLQKYVGKDVEVKTKELGKQQGKLVSFDAEKVEFAPAPKKASKKKPAEEPANLCLERNKVEIKPAIIF